VGLGNPGKAYAASRHNIGFLVVDHFAKEEGFPRAKKKMRVLSTEKRIGEETVVLIKPETFMNSTGPALREFLRYFGYVPALGLSGGSKASDDASGDRASGGGAPGSKAPGSGFASGSACGLEDQLLVVHDDLDLPEGKLRFRSRGSSGGHRGVDSIIEALGTIAFGRLKVGIGRPEGREARDYVLEPLQGSAEEKFLRTAVMAAKTLPVWIREGLEVSARQFNGPGPETRSKNENRGLQ